MRRVVDLVADPGSVYELRPTWATGVITALARVGGRSIGIVATDGTVDEGRLTGDGCDKITRFLQLCDAFGLPLVLLVDSAGPAGDGAEADTQALFRHAARIPLTMSNLRVPLTTVIVGRAGGGSQVLLGGAGRPGQELLQHALAAVGSGVTVVDLRLPDQPLVYVNPAFERLAGAPAGEVLGRNCRFLQCPDTDPAAVARIRQAIADGAECTEVLLNRRADGSTWWNECRLTPVRDPAGAVVQYIGVQTDVTARVEAERALATERDRSRDYATRLAEVTAADGALG